MFECGVMCGGDVDDCDGGVYDLVGVCGIDYEIE